MITTRTEAAYMEQYLTDHRRNCIPDEMSKRTAGVSEYNDTSTLIINEYRFDLSGCEIEYKAAMLTEKLNKIALSTKILTEFSIAIKPALSIGML